MARECKINPNGGPVTVQLSVDNGIISGGDFSIYDFNSGQVAESFKMHTDTTGNAFYQVRMPPQGLLGKVLSWQVLSCTPIITNSCNLDVVIIQDGNECQMNTPAHFPLSNLPNCAVGQALPAKGGMHFVK